MFITARKGKGESYGAVDDEQPEASHTHLNYGRALQLLNQATEWTLHNLRHTGHGEIEAPRPRQLSALRPRPEHAHRE